MRIIIRSWDFRLSLVWLLERKQLSFAAPSYQLLRILVFLRMNICPFVPFLYLLSMRLLILVVSQSLQVVLISPFLYVLERVLAAGCVGHQIQDTDVEIGQAIRFAGHVSSD